MDLDTRMGEIERRLDALERRARFPGDAREPRRGVRESARPARVERSILDEPAVAARIEESAAAGGAPAAVPAPSIPASAPESRVESPAPVPLDPPRGPRPRPRLARPAPAPRGAEWERFVGVAVLGRVGIGAILLAAAWFAQLAYQAFPPVWRVVSIEALAATLAGVGFAIRPKVSVRFLAILWGGAAAAAYMAGVAARLRYGIVGPVGAGAMLVAACALGQALARIAGVRALAHVALAGAFAAPFLVGAPTDARTSLLVYVLVLHGWAAFTEARWGWRGARLLAVAGAAVTATSWVLRHGHADVSTCLHLHLYLVGLTAPEWLAAIRGRDATPARARVSFGLLFAAELLLVGAFSWQGPEALTRGFPLVAGLFWTGLAVVARLRAGAPSPSVRGLARVGQLLLVVAAITAWPRDWSLATLEPAILVALSAAAIAFAALRGRLGTGTLAAVLATGASLVVLSLRAAPDPWLAVALLAPGALALLCDPRARPAGMAAGVVAIGLSLARAPDPWWQAVAFAVAGAWIAGGYALAVRRRDDLARGAADALWMVSCLLWAWAALVGPFAGVAPWLGNPGTFAALALCVLPWIRRRAGAATGDAALEGAMRVALLAVFLGAAWREWHAVAGSVSALALSQWHATAFLVAAAGFVLATGRRAFAELHGTAAALLYLAAAVVVGAHAPEPGSAWAFAGELALLALPLGFLRGGPQGHGDGRWALLVLLPAAFWAAAALSGPLADVAPHVANARLLSAALLAALAARLRAQDVAGPRAVVLGACAALVAYAGGLAETLDAVARLDSPTLRHALVSVYSALAAGVVLAIGFARRAPDLRWLALLGFGAVIGKVGLHDLADSTASVRILVTGVLGVILLFSAYAYARRERAAGSPASEEPRLGT